LTVPKVKATLTFDGGSLGNPGPAYGSYLLESKSTSAPLRRLVRLNFGRGTNNEAEYWTLIAGVRAMTDALGAMGERPVDVELTVRGDSQLVLRQVAGEWKTKDARMRQLCGDVQDLLGDYGRVSLRHQPRAKSVRRLGH